MGDIRHYLLQNDFLSFWQFYFVNIDQSRVQIDQNLYFPKGKLFGNMKSTKIMKIIFLHKNGPKWPQTWFSSVPAPTICRFYLAWLTACTKVCPNNLFFMFFRPLDNEGCKLNSGGRESYRNTSQDTDDLGAWYFSFGS